MPHMRGWHQHNWHPWQRSPKSANPKSRHSFLVGQKPPIDYGTAFIRSLIWIYNLCIDHPAKDILMLPDDISSAFHQIFYHPSMMPVFASIFATYLCIPAGCIFGSHSSPGYYMLAGELHAWLAGTSNFGTAHAQLVGSSIISPVPIQGTQNLFVPASADAFNFGAKNLTSTGMNALYPVFVDDMANVNTRSRVLGTVTALVLSAYVIVGFPSGDLWGNHPPCINESKWKMDSTHHMSFLGFHIDSCKLTITWPMDKQLCLHQCIAEILQLVHHGSHVPCRLLAQVLGLLRNGAIVLPFSATFSLWLQHAFNDKILAAFKGKPVLWKYRVFWDTAVIRITSSIAEDLKEISKLLDIDHVDSKVWCHPISLIIPWESQYTFFSDASYDGIGG